MNDILYLTDIFVQNMLFSYGHGCALWTLSVLRINLNMVRNKMFMEGNDKYYIP